MNYESLHLKLDMHTSHGKPGRYELSFHRSTVLIPTVSIPYNFATGDVGADKEEAIGMYTALHCISRLTLMISFDSIPHLSSARRSKGGNMQTRHRHFYVGASLAWTARSRHQNQR